MNELNSLRILNKKQVYDIINRLMELADKNENEEFISVIDENYQEIFQNPNLRKMHPDNIIMSGLIARNKTELLKYLTEKLDAEKFMQTDRRSLILLIGTLILEKKNTEAINYFLEKKAASFGNSELEYIFTAIIAADELTLFRTVYSANKDRYIYFEGSVFHSAFDVRTSPWEMAILEGVIFGSKNILDFVTDNGNAFRAPETLGEADFLVIQELSYAHKELFYQYQKRCMPEVCWLEKLHSMYFKDESPENAYDYLVRISEKINIMKRKFNALFEDENSENKLLRAEITRICGMKTNDLSFAAYYRQNFPSNFMNSKYIAKLLKDVADKNPYVDFIASEFGIINVDSIISFADKAPKKLTVRLICGFDGEDINLLRGKVKFELDISDPRTDEYLRKIFDKPLGIKLEETNYIFELITALIEEKLITPRKLIKLVNTVKCPEIVNFLFNYNKNRK